MRRTPTPFSRAALFALATLAALGVGVGGASAQSLSAPKATTAAQAERMLDKLNRRGDLTLSDATLESALFTISELWGVNIVAAKVEGAVNGVFKDAPLRDILDTILLSNGYAYRPVGGSLVVSRMQDLGQLNPFFVSETIPVGVAEVGEVVEAARLMSTPQGQVRALPSAGAVLVVDFPDRVNMIRDLVRQLDTATRGGGPGPGGLGPQQLEVAYFRTHYVTAAQAASAIDIVLSASGRTAPVDSEDRLLVVDYAENVRMVEAVLARVDRPRPQVNIKALIYDISLSDMEKIGINWNGISNGSIDNAGVATGKNTGLRFLTQTAAPLDPSGTGGAFTFYSLEGDLDLRALVVALQQAEDSRLLADPNVTVMDNEQANIESISEIPFQQLTQTTGGGNIGTTAFKEVGIKLDVIPKIARDATIDMTVVPEFSRLAGFTPGDNQPIVETRRATTRVRVANGQTLMIAGLRQRTDVGDFNGVPLLKDIRYLGHLFRSRETRIEESELVVFITPEIIGFADPLGERDRLSSDTIRCRLDRIPAAEGCPECGAESCECAVGQPTLADPVREVPVAMPAPVSAAPPAFTAPQPTPSLPEPAETVPEPVEEITPLPSHPIAPPSVGAATSRSPLRRLPPTRPQTASVTPPPTATAEERRMRVDYDSRFRATGGVYPNQQRMTSRPEPAAEPADGKPSRSWYFWR